MKLKFFIIINILMSSIMLRAQPDFRVLSGNQEIIQNCIDSVVYLIRQDYVLQSGNKSSLTYGRGDNKYFGRIYTLAVLADGKLWCDNKVLTPWTTDTNYQEYATIDTLKPVLSDVQARPVYSSKFSPVTPDTLLKIGMYDSLMKKSGIYTYNIETKAKGLQIIHLGKSDAGWLVLGNTDTDLNLNDNIRIKLSVYKEKPDYADKELTGKIKNPINPSKVTGGFYILPLYSTGRVEWQVSGIFVKKLLNYCVTSIPEKPIVKISPPEAKKALTPINPKSPLEQDNKK